MSDNERPNLIINIDQTLKNTFKATCAMQGVSMSDVLIKYIDSYVNQKQRVRK